MAGLFRWSGRKEDGPAAAPVAVQAASDLRSTSKVLPRVLTALAARDAPVLLNLGPVVGQTISFLGEQLNCKIIVEDLLADLGTVTVSADDPPEARGRALVARLPQEPASVDGILCWDLFDYLDRPTSQVLAAHLVALLRPGGVVYGFFGTAAGDVSERTRFVVEAADTLRLTSLPIPPMRRHIMVTRDITRMFDGLVVTESVLLKTNRRETLFRKP